jgi:hypothetical protein
MTESTQQQLEPAPSPVIEPPRGGFSRRGIVMLVAGGVFLALVVASVLYYRSGTNRRQQEVLLKATLDHLVTAQEGFYYDSARYATTLRALKAFTVPAGARVQLAPPMSHSWSATATHPMLKDHVCVVWVGTPPTSLPDDVRRPENETKPLCFDIITPHAR